MTQRGQNTSESNSILPLMGFDPISFEALLETSGLTKETISSMLMMLKLEGKVTTLAGGKYQRLIQ